MTKKIKSLNYDIYSYFLYYFLVLYFAIIFVAFFHTSIFILSSTIKREIFIALVLYLSFLSMNYYKTGYLKPLYALLELFPLLPIILYFKGKFFSKNQKELGTYFIYSLLLFIFIFSFTIVISALALIYKPLFFSMVGSKPYADKFLKPVAVYKNTSSFIILHNLAFLSLIILGGPFLYIPTFAGSYFMAIITMPVLAGAIISGYFNYILPNAILEISGTIIAAASSFILFMFVLESIKENKQFIFPKKYLKYIISGLIMSLMSFLFAWPIEVLLITRNITFVWLKAFYFIDLYILVVDFIIIFKLFRGTFMSPLEYFSLYFFISLFLFGLVGAKTIHSSIWYLILFGTFSNYFMLYSLFSIFNSNNEIGKIDGDLIYVIARGKSMTPVIEGGDILIIKRVNSIEELSIGDIITYRTSAIYSPLNNSGIVTHRIIKIMGDKIFAKGDNNASIDAQTIYPDDIIGVVLAKLTYITGKVQTLEILKQDDKIKSEFPYINNLNPRVKHNNQFHEFYLVLISFLLIILVLV
ncbi:MULTISPECIES: signal peptidase I [Acidiplasma]|uniref:Peptidase S24/S26A/S26B/S26C domain-containing protein n=4 Tax=Acidiplasma TaxID=507753 RepID=A0A0Q1B7C3_9ARCH|nr:MULTISPECIES: signal peptidase I [Acidiplasma]KQB33617.1 hypothetical protein AOG54_01895 [Acidiplasma aeolicum]KQB36063.1 hypothetical protein AOG55_05130 [Acidiplasma cupricumulans]